MNGGSGQSWNARTMSSTGYFVLMKRPRKCRVVVAYRLSTILETWAPAETARREERNILANFICVISMTLLICELQSLGNMMVPGPVFYVTCEWSLALPLCDMRPPTLAEECGAVVRSPFNGPSTATTFC